MTIPSSGGTMFGNNLRRLNRSRHPVLRLEALEVRENPYGGVVGPVEYVSISNPTVTEGGTASFVVTPAPGHPAINASFLTLDGTATGSAGRDCQVKSGRLAWGVGDDTPQVIQVPTFNDSTHEPTEWFGLRVWEGNPNSEHIGASGWEAYGYGTITDDDPKPPPPPPGPKISVGNLRLSEGTDGAARVASFPITLSSPLTYRLNVNAATVAGTASGAAGDYAARSAVLTWAPGESGTKYFDISITPDRACEPDETFKVQVSATAGGAKLAAGVGTIVNDDPQHRISQAGVYRNGQWFLDTAGDGMFAERVVNFGLAGDTAVAADWNRDRRTDLTVVRPNPATGLLDWYVDLNQDGMTDFVKSFGLIGDRPVVGDFDNNGRTDMGVVRKNPATNRLDWYFDLDGKGGRAEKVVPFGLVSANDIPVVADWNRDGKSDIGTYRPGTSFTGGAQWFINLPDKHGQPRVLNLGNAGWSPVAADFNGDGRIDAGLWRHNAERGGLDWLIDLGANESIDVGLQYGLPGDQPLAGMW